MLRWLFVALLALHGAIHAIGVAKAFFGAEIAALSQPVTRGWGVVWLGGLLLLLATALLVGAHARGWWLVGSVALVVSQAAIASSWVDAKVGTIANVIVLLACVYGAASEGPTSFAAEYRRAVAQRTGDASPGPTPTQKAAPTTNVTEADVLRLPPPLQRFLRRAGVVGRPRVSGFHATWRGRIRSGPQDEWMSFTAEQHNFLGEPSRFFRMHATRAGLPVDVFHAFEGGAASMRVRLLSLFPLVEAQGAEMTRAETVTLFNDVALLAPSELVDPAITWELLDEHAVRGSYTAGRETIRAVLQFDEAGDLVDFVSDDRLATSPDGKAMVQTRWSTPILERKTFDGVTVIGRAEGRWHPDAGEFAYLEIELLELGTADR